jgi:hypothetical protein
MNKNIYYEFFENNLKNNITKYEEYRIKIVKKIVFYSLLMFMLGILSAGVFIYLSYINNLTVLLLPIMLFLMYVCFIKSIINVMWEGKKYQKWLVETILPLFYEPVANFKNLPKNNDTESIINSQIFGNFDTREDEKAIFGIYKDVNIIVSDTRLTFPVKSAVKTNLFKGTLIQLELPESFKNHIVLISKNMPKCNKYKQINPHIKDLNNYLYCFAKKDNEFISENFWQIIKRFGKAYTAKSFALSYNDNVMLIALSQKNPWHFGFVFKSLLKAKNYDDLVERFIVIYDLIDFTLSC